MTLLTDMIRMQRRQQRQLIDIDAREVVPVVARYTTNAGQSIPDSAVTVINFEDQTFDPRGAVATGAAWVFTCPVAGYYAVTAKVQFVATTAWANGELLALDIYIGGAQNCRLYASETHGSTASAEVSAGGHCIVHLDKSDTLNVRVTQSSGGALALVADGTENYICIARITP